MPYGGLKFTKVGRNYQPSDSYCTIFTINVRNGHIIFIMIEHIKNIEISELENTERLLVLVRNLFINFELKVST